MRTNLKTDYDVYEQRGNYIIFSDCSHKLYSFYYKCEIKTQPNKNKISTHLKKSYTFLLVLALLISIFVKMPVDDKVYKDFYSPYEILGTSRSSEKDSISIALELISEKYYYTAFNILDSTKDHNIVSHFYLGVLYQQNTKYRDAIKEYKIIINNKDNLFVEQSEWYLGLCYLQIHETRRAIKQFEILANKKGFYQLKSQEILKRIKKSLI